MNNLQIIKNPDWKEVEINGETKEIPIDWNIQAFGNTVIINGKNLSKEIKEINYIDIASVKENQIQEATFMSTNFPSRAKRIVSECDTIVSTVRPNLKCFSYVNKNYHNYVCSTGFAVLSPLKNKINSEFLYLKFKQQETTDFLVTNCEGGTYPAFNSSLLKSFEYSDPPLNQQDSIASILSKQESIIADIENFIVKHEARFQYLSDELLSGKIRVKKENGELVLYRNTEWKEVEVNGEITGIPSDWEVEKLKNHILVVNGYAFPKSKMLNQPSTISVPIIKIGNIQDNLIIENSGTGQNYYEGEMKKVFMPQYNDLIIGLSGANAGKTGIFKLKFSTVLNQRNAIVRINLNKITQEYFNYFWFKDALEILRETTKDSAIPNISSDDIENIDILIFTKTEQLNIVNLLNIEQDIIRNTKQILIKEKQKFEWLLDNLLSGKYLIKENNNE